jgi:hypothetical protein
MTSLFFACVQVSGVCLDTIFEDLPAESQDALITQLAMHRSHLSFPAIGSIALSKSSCDPSTPPTPVSVSASPALPLLGPLTHPCFYVEGRTALSIDRGPFPTARAYFLACAERERAATRALFTQGATAGAEYQALLAETQTIVERSVTLLIELVRRCEGLDSADPELARYALDLHELGPKNIIVAQDDPTCIVRRFLEPKGDAHLIIFYHSPSLVGNRRLAVRIRLAVVALCAHAVLALALAHRR